MTSSIDFAVNQEYKHYENFEKHLKLYAEKKRFTPYHADAIKWNNSKKVKVDVPEYLQYFMLKIGCSKGKLVKSKSKGVREKA